jgi:hypothetical protein
MLSLAGYINLIIVFGHIIGLLFLIGGLKKWEFTTEKNNGHKPTV